MHTRRDPFSSRLNYKFISGGHLVKLLGNLISHILGVTVSLPPLLGMLVVGKIFLFSWSEMTRGTRKTMWALICLILVQRYPSQEHPLQFGTVWPRWMHRGRAQCIFCWFPSRPEQPRGSGGSSYDFGSPWRLPPSLYRARAWPDPLKRLAHPLPGRHPPQVEKG